MRQLRRFCHGSTASDSPGAFLAVSVLRAAHRLCRSTRIILLRTLSVTYRQDVLAVETRPQLF